MRTTYRFVTPEGESVPLVGVPTYRELRATVVAVRLLPSIGDPDDPDDVDELEITLELDE